MSISTIKQQQKAKKVSFPPFFPLLHGRTENLIWIVASASSLAWKTDSNSKKKSEGEKEIEEDQHNRTFPATAIPRNPFTEKIPIRRGKKGKSPMPAVPRSSRKSNVLQESAKYFFLPSIERQRFGHDRQTAKKKEFCLRKKLSPANIFSAISSAKNLPRKISRVSSSGFDILIAGETAEFFPFKIASQPSMCGGKKWLFFPSHLSSQPKPVVYHRSLDPKWSWRLRGKKMDFEKG